MDVISLVGVIIILTFLEVIAQRWSPVSLRTLEKLKNDGYPVEIHQLVTEDHYILHAIRVRYGREKPTSLANRSAVLLCPGLSATPDLFFVMPKGEALGYYLADHGFDVWALAVRGTEPGLHKHYDWNTDVEYWDYSWHEVGAYDFTAAIDYIIANTDQKAVFFIGHSASNTALFVMLSERPEYNKKTKIAAMYAPSGLLGYVEYPLARALCAANFFFEVFQKVTGLVVIPYSEYLQPVVRGLCAYEVVKPICVEVVHMIGAQRSVLFDADLLPIIFNTIPQRVAIRELLHYAQLVSRGGFRQYDYGPRVNVRKYGQKTPPDYSFQNCTAAIAFMYSETDTISPEVEVMENIKLLPNVVMSYKVPFRRFTHLDFVLGRNASKLVYQQTAQLFHDFDSGKVQDIRKKR